MDKNSFIVHVKTDKISIDIAEDIKTKSEIDRPFPKRKKSNWANVR